MKKIFRNSFLSAGIILCWIFTANNIFGQGADGRVATVSKKAVIKTTVSSKLKRKPEVVAVYETKIKTKKKKQIGEKADRTREIRKGG